MTKKNRHTRLVSALLVLVMLLSVFPTQVFGTEQEVSRAEGASTALGEEAVPEEEALPEEKAPTKSGADYLAQLDRLPLLFL